MHIGFVATASATSRERARWSSEERGASSGGRGSTRAANGRPIAVNLPVGKNFDFRQGPVRPMDRAPAPMRIRILKRGQLTKSGARQRESFPNGAIRHVRMHIGGSGGTSPSRNLALPEPRPQTWATHLMTPNVVHPPCGPTADVLPVRRAGDTTPKAVAMLSGSLWNGCNRPRALNWPANRANFASAPIPWRSPMRWGCW